MKKTTLFSNAIMAAMTGLAIAPSYFSEKPEYAAEQIECMAMAVYHEARSEDAYSQIMVAATVKNAAFAHKTSICDEVRKPHRYGDTRHWWAVSWTTPTEKEAWENAVEVATLTLSGDIKPRKGHRGVTHFHDKTASGRVVNKYFSGMKPVYKTSNMTFYEDPHYMAVKYSNWGR